MGKLFKVTEPEVGLIGWSAASRYWKLAVPEYILNKPGKTH
jgi:hypothetical protein